MPRRMWEQFKIDVVEPEARIQSLAGWLLLALVVLIVIHTLVYAPDSRARS